MKKLLSIAFIISLIFAFTGCGNYAEKETSGTESNTVTGETADDDTEAISEGTKSAVVYFSATGNTEKIAKLIASETDSDIYEITPAEEYSSDDINYNDDSCRANKEMNDSSARPEIGSDLSSTEKYDVIYLGYPVWWGTAPRIIQTYLESYDLSNAKIYTFCTSGGSSIDKSISDLQGYYPSLAIISGKRLNDASADDINEWIQNLQK